MVAQRYRSYKPALYSYRIVDREVGLFEIVQNSPWPKRAYLVMLTGEHMSCTCPSGRRGFQGAGRGYCQHIYALVTFALQYRGGSGHTYTFSYIYEPGMGLD